ncbi:hypothetical protein SDRG_05740 [Saprolegnia diclina VS20]|uniref:Aminotransferase class IV n=1 Tax=Saprolegnia diclina (strain VS20) TaxID=1156394 RepID=T0RWM7_SAPDV|nr:hypothetical protein SDRG_05740 [Saprolegnia diclina VS20]EQC36913.1 hypothetical protein SDRG_05740 [Saprolegnia diclina VS20]|eukprot:XP_008609694.1 hypothetical protein SDRG_05740 [Saprolegnia diclina VS20]
MTPKEFLTSFRIESGGEYTCLRMRHGRVCMWPFHRARLALDASQGDALPAEIVRAATDTFGEAASTKDLMVTIVNVNGRHHIHVYAMPGLSFVGGADNGVPQVSAVDVLVLGPARRNPGVKHVSWIDERKYLEAAAAEKAAELGIGSFGEVLLSQRDADTHHLLEGLITNFFVLHNGRLYTARDDVLLGSTRELVLQACERLCIPVVHEPPVLEASATWEAAFVTSVVRMIVPVKTLRRQDTGTWHTYSIRTAPERLHQLRSAIYELCDADARVG